MKMITNYHSLFGRKRFCLTKRCVIRVIIIILTINLVILLNRTHTIQIGDSEHRVDISWTKFELLLAESNYTYEKFIQWNQSLCSIQSNRRGPHQKVIALSIYGSTSKFSNNPMFSWDKSILPFLQPLAKEVETLLPSWTIRLYIDFIGSTKAQRAALYQFSNVDICDMTSLPLFGSSIFEYLPGKLWRFLPIFDPYVDYLLSRDLDSPMTQREIETIDMWMSKEQEKNFFYIARDHMKHEVPIMGGLCGAAVTNARDFLFTIFRPMLVPSIGSLYTGTGDQEFLSDFVWLKVKERSLIFDSYSCRMFGGQPFPSQRPKGYCFLGCIRPCCTNTTDNESLNFLKPCPRICRPRNHKDWTYC